ncbi:MAG TPA: AMP-binding protein [Rhizomicrobium sp.]|nr:AMP-binding protein [Rhizomicrobium sp.]
MTRPDALRAAIRHAYDNTAYGRAKCDAAGVTPDDLRSLEDLQRFPFTLKGDFREHYPWGMCAVPRERLARVHASSGTTGKPTIVGYTQADLDLWDSLMARCLATAGVRPGDLLHNAYGYGLFTGGLGFHGGAEKLGCAVVPASGGQTERQIQLILDLEPRVLCCTPSYALVLAEALGGRKTSLEIALCGAEPWSAQMQSEIEQRLGVTALDVYGLSEVLGPGVAVERPDARGLLTVWEDAFHPEIVDPATGVPLPDGEEGELVFTSLAKEAVPVIRYRTGDLSRLHPPIGDVPYRRMERIKGRSDDMLIVRGVNIFPRQIEELILEEPSLSPHYRIEVTRDGARDVLTVTVEGSAPCGLGERMKSRYGLSAVIVLAEAGTLPRSEGKAKRVFDRRKGQA